MSYFQNKTSGVNTGAFPMNKKREPKPGKMYKKNASSRPGSPKSKAKRASKKTSFAGHKLGKDSVFKQDKQRQRKRRYIKILVLVAVFVVVTLAVSLVIYFLTDNDNKQDDNNVNE